MEQEIKICRNCNASLEHAKTYCTACGQKQGTGKVTLRELGQEFLSNIFNFDSKTFRTATALFIPGKLTLEYFRGKHKSYSHPMRLFFVMAVLFFAIVTWNDINIGSTGDTGLMQEFRKRVDRSNTLYEIDSLKKEIVLAYPQPEVQAALDSLLQQLEIEESIDSLNFDSEIIDIGLNVMKVGRDSITFDSTKVSIQDFISMPVSDFMDQYCADLTFGVKILARQTLKIIRDGQNMFDYLMSNLPLMLLLMMPFLALFLKALYFRRHRYYVEHLFFSFHFHAFVFLWGALLILLRNVLPVSLLAILWLCIFVYLFMALKAVYQQSWGKSLLKFFIIIIGYIVLVIVFFILSLVLSFILF